MPTIREIFGTIIDVHDAFAELGQFQALLKMDRGVAMQHLSSQVECLSPQQLDAFEVQFLNQSMSVFDRDQRVRAMELYAWLKIQECAHYKEFRGFAAPKGPLP